jgi:FkbM family methyltransferase
MADAFSFTYDGTVVNVPRDFHGYYLDFYYNSNFYEDVMLRYIRSLGLTGTYVDVGGGVGNHSLFFALFCGTKVHSFEPRDIHRTFLTNLINANSVQDRVILHPLAASDHTGMVRATFVIGKEANVTGNVPCTRLDDTIIENDVKVIKIDVEGAETSVLRGATGVLKRCRPNLYIEAHTERETVEIMDVIKPLGYFMTGKVFNASPTYEFIAR